MGDDNLTEATSAADTAAPQQHHALLSRLVRNVGWLLGGRGFTGIASLFYLGVAARALGPERFGVFTLIWTYGQFVANVIQFDSWKGVIRFGAVHLAERQTDRLSRLLGFSVMLDLTAGVIGAVVAAAGVTIIAPLFHWSGEEQAQAAVLAVVLLLTSGATPIGMLRLFNRFDLLTYSEALAPALRLGGAIVAWLAGGGVGAFLFVWAIAAFAQAVATWAAALAVQEGRLAIGYAAFRRAARENRHLWRFTLQTNVSSSLAFLGLQAGTLAVGAVAGPATAGAFRLADRLASGIMKTTETVTLALYPELARLVASNDRATLQKLFLRTSRVSAFLAIVVIVACAIAGKLFLRIIAGPQFEFAQPLLLLLAISASINLFGLVLEPFHNAHGHAGRVLRARAIGTIVYFAALAALLPSFNAVGAAIAAIIMSAVVFIQLAVSARSILRTGSTSAPLER